MMRHNFLKPGLLVPVVLIGGGAWLAISGGWIHAKGQLARGLIDKAWTQTLAGDTTPKPWPWADTWPVARLNFPSHDRLVTVLAGAQGATLAFGPGHMDGTAPPGLPGNSVIAGHRDTSFRFFGSLQDDDPVRLQMPDGTWKSYRVIGRQIVDSRKEWIPPDPVAGASMLTLVTCWPLDAVVPGGPERLLIYAEEIPDEGAPA